MSKKIPPRVDSLTYRANKLTWNDFFNFNCWRSNICIVSIYAIFPRVSPVYRGVSGSEEEASLSCSSSWGVRRQRRSPRGIPPGRDIGNSKSNISGYLLRSVLQPFPLASLCGVSSKSEFLPRFFARNSSSDGREERRKDVTERTWKRAVAIPESVVVHSR